MKFFFKQKTAYEIMPSLVGSEMCIRDRYSRWNDTVINLKNWMEILTIFFYMNYYKIAFFDNLHYTLFLVH